MKNQTKIALLYHGHMDIAQFRDPRFEQKDEAHLTGYPCDKGTYNENEPDTLVEKHVKVSALKTDGKKGSVGYNLFTCKGDSGAPLWIEKDGKYYIVGVHHGGGSDCGFSADYNCSMAFDEQSMNWIRQHTH